jgi:hypothetical protein
MESMSLINTSAFRKGGCPMKTRKILVVVALLGISLFVASGSQALAGGGPLPPTATVFHGPEIWGSVVVYCGTPPNPTFVVVRVKRVVDCNVETEVVVDPAWTFGCPADDPSVPLNWSLPAGTKFFGLPGTPYITKVQNWKNHGSGTLFSFDAQFKFWE